MTSNRSNLTIAVDVLPGTDLKEALEEAKQKAKLWQVRFVTFEYNRGSFSVSAEADVDAGMREYSSTIMGNPYIVL